MADVPFELALAVGVQSGLGSINATIRDLSGALDAATHGIVLGDPEVGIGEKGIDVTWNRELAENAKVGNFTTVASNFLREAVEGLSIGWKLKGNGNVLSGAPADGEFVLDPGIDALHQGLGLAGAAWGAGVGRIYVPAPAVYLTVKLWVGRRTADGFSLAWVFQDCVATGSLSWTPRGVGAALAEIAVGSVAQFSEMALPTFDYQEQASQSAPVVQGVAHAWGATRGFQKFEVAISNEIEELDDSNQATGVRQRYVDRAIEASCELFADSVDLDFERSRLVATGAPTDLMSFTVGTPGVPAGRALAHRVRLTTPELRSLKPLILGDLLGWACELRAVSGTPNGDFELIYL